MTGPVTITPLVKTEATEGAKQHPGIPFPFQEGDPVGPTELMLCEPIYGTRVANSLADRAFYEPFCLLLVALQEGQAVYARGEKVQAHLRDTLPGSTMTLTNGSTVHGAELIDKVRWNDEPPTDEFFDPAKPYEERLTQPFTAPGPLHPAPRPKPTKPGSLPEHLEFPCDRIHKGAVEGLSFIERWERRSNFWRGYTPSAKTNGGFSLQMGFRTDPGEAIWEFLLQRGEAAIKAHYALWTRLYQQTGGEPGRYAVMDIRQFCDDLGYKKHHKGGFRREQKQDAMRLLEALTTVEIAAEYTPNGEKTATRRLRGELWKRGFIAEEQDRYDDLFGQAREGDPSLWDPVGFTFEPGPWFRDPVWRRDNQYLGQIGAGLLRLSTHTDQVAIRIGGYLGTLARIGKYRTRRLRVDTLLKRIGLADRYPNHPRRLQDAIKRAWASS